MIPANLALRRLIKGNQRFVGRTSRVHAGWEPGLVEGQAPFAVILGCSDSRAPAELVFDQGLGDLFVIRVAGNVVAPSGIGSVEFAALQFGTRLVVVMGHSHCGAISATIEAARKPNADYSRNLRAITDRIHPHIAHLIRPGASKAEIAREAVRANVRASAAQLRHGSAVLEKLIGEGKLAVAQAEYDLETGVVDFFDISG